MKSKMLILWFALLSLGLLGLTLAWHVPMMLWDHLDLIPVYQAWQRGELTDSNFWQPYNGHMLAAAYLLLMATTDLSNGHPWLDCCTSWTLLSGSAALIFTWIKRTLATNTSGEWLLAATIGFYAFYPGHLINLQWGWQVGMFLSLSGAVVVVQCLAIETLTWLRVSIAALATTLALFSFAAALALIPTSIILIALRTECPRGLRFRFAFPWIIAGLFLVAWQIYFHYGVAVDNVGNAAIYALNFIGSGVARFAKGLAPALALVGLVTGAYAFYSMRLRRDGLPWFGLVLFGFFCALLAAIGRADSLGDDQAFVSRYVTFSSMFWLGWVGLMTSFLRENGAGLFAWRKVLLALITICAAINAVALTKRAAHVGEESRSLAAAIRLTYPNVDESLLRKIYFNRPKQAADRLNTLHALQFAPFDDSDPMNSPSTQ